MLSNGVEKTDFSVQFTTAICNICGQDHEINVCHYISEINYISDAPIIPRAKQTLPSGLEIRNLSDGSSTVVAKTCFPKGTTFGPLEAKKQHILNPLSTFLLKIFGNTELDTYILDCTNENISNWMSFISSASNAEEQNLICYQVDQNIHYSAIREITIGDELKVWYSPYYAKKMKMPIFITGFVNSSNNNFIISDKKEFIEYQDQVSNKNTAEELAIKLSAQKLGATLNLEIWNCKLCSSEIKTVVTYAKHLMEHCKTMLSVSCDICNKKFFNSSVLKRHKKIKHNIQSCSNNNMKKLLMAENNINDLQSVVLNVNESKEQILDSETKLLNNDTNATLISSKLLDVNYLLRNDESQSVNMNLNNVTEMINSDTVEDNIIINNLDCDICKKKFDKLDYLYRHLRKHTGEFICPTCLTVFARKENLISHACNSQNQEPNFECSFCGKTFYEKKYLKRHMAAKHIEPSNCKWCGHVFTMKSESTLHICLAPKFMCVLCRKKFVNKTHLNRHLKSHSNPEAVQKKKSEHKKQASKSLICEKCGDVLKNISSLKQHLYLHGERLFECDICQKKFHRISVLKEHQMTHNEHSITCDICNKKLKSKKALSIHILLHGNRKHHCDKCNKSFFQKCNYIKHYKQKHSTESMFKCSYCSQKFIKKLCLDKHMMQHTKSAEFSCSICMKSFHKEYQLRRHFQANHSGIIYKCPFCKMSARHKHSMKRHFERQHSDLKDEWDVPGFVDTLTERNELSKHHVEQHQQENIHLKTYLETQNFENVESVSLLADNTNSHASNIEQIIVDNVSLSIPEIIPLNTVESNVNLDEIILQNALIFNEGEGNIMFYILDNISDLTENN